MAQSATRVVSSRASAVRLTRCHTEDVIIGSACETSLSIGQTLPSKLKVLKRVLFLRKQNPNLSQQDLFCTIIDELEDIWQRAGFTSDLINRRNQLIRELAVLFLKWTNIKKASNSRRKTKQFIEDKARFLSDMKFLFDLAPSNIEHLLRSSRLPTWREDFDFLQGQRKIPQEGRMAGIDNSSIQREKNRIKRNSQPKEGNLHLTDATDTTEEQNSMDDISDSDEDFHEPVRFRAKSATVAIELPRKYVSKATTSLADRTGLSIRGHTAIQASLIKVGGGSVNDFAMSRSTTHRHRLEARAELSTSIREHWTSSKQTNVILHWDSKAITYVDGKTDERLAVLVTGVGISSRHKLLGIPIIPHSTGWAQKEAIIDLVRQWDIEGNVVGMTFDSTASNTGEKNGSASLIEQHMGHALLWLTCRRHIYELHIKHAAVAVSGKTVGPGDGLFKRFRKDWDNIDHSVEDLILFNWQCVDSFLQDQAKNVLQWGEKCLENDTFPREDYKELIQLTVLYFGGEIKGRFVFRKPGAFHHARFMSKCIYYLKIQMMNARFIMSNEERSQVRRMADFVALFHSKSFLRSSLASAAPVEDLQYFFLMNQYRQHDEQLADAVILSCKRHLWYLCEELVALCIFNKNLHPLWRAALARKLFETPRPSVFSPAKPGFPSIDGDECILSFIGPRSWLIFHLLKMSREQVDWMQLPVEYWDRMTYYRQVESFVNNLPVINDAAERGVKLVTDFKDFTQDPSRQEDLFQVIEEHRNRVASINSKRDLENV
jgi:hypothetical protein